MDISRDEGPCFLACHRSGPDEFIVIGQIVADEVLQFDSDCSTQLHAGPVLGTYPRRYRETDILWATRMMDQKVPYHGVDGESDGRLWARIVVF